MTAKKRPPNLVNRIYRQGLAIKKQLLLYHNVNHRAITENRVIVGAAYAESVHTRLTNIENTVATVHEHTQGVLKVQADTIARLLRQHDTLKRMPCWPQMERELVAANAYVAQPLPSINGDSPVPVLSDATGSIAALRTANAAIGVARVKSEAES